jgi:hypothetical protein
MDPAEQPDLWRLDRNRRGHGAAVPDGSVARPVAKICVVAFSVAIPLLAALVLVNWQEAFRRRVTKSVSVEIARVVAQLCAFVGVVAGFWHILWIAGVGMLAGGLVGVAVHSAGYVRLERDQEATPRKARNPATPSHSPYSGPTQKRLVPMLA